MVDFDRLATAFPIDIHLYSYVWIVQCIYVAVAFRFNSLCKSNLGNSCENKHFPKVIAVMVRCLFVHIVYMGCVHMVLLDVSGGPMLS